MTQSSPQETLQDPTPIPDDSFPHWALRLFLSVDIVGSTAHKHGGAKKGSDASSPILELGPPWLRTFAEFYSRFSDYLTEAWTIGVPHFSTEGDPPVFWKSSGDELLFSCKLASSAHAGKCIDAFRLALIRYRTILRKNSSRLNLKACAWIAGFPINNIEVIIGEDPDWLKKYDSIITDNYVARTLLRTENYFRTNNDDQRKPDPYAKIEFIGPQMDLGFRLAAHSTPREMVVSADLAYLLAETNIGFITHNGLPRPCSQSLSYAGKRELKGILGGTPYPIFWLDADPGLPLNEAEDVMLGRMSLHHLTIKNFCQRFLESSEESWLQIPFIWSPKLPQNSIPEMHHNARRAYQAALEKAHNAINENKDDNAFLSSDVPGQITKQMTRSQNRVNPT